MADEDDSYYYLSAITPRPDNLSPVKSLSTTPICTLSTEGHLSSQFSVFHCPPPTSHFSCPPLLTTNLSHPLLHRRMLRLHRLRSNLPNLPSILSLRLEFDGVGEYDSFSTVYCWRSSHTSN
ncbi:unnamed protein product [Schistocephalus solidus]|uniref:Ovule protein n=1 Tax=Schistocephalus solidus TaxID=70667 RepID=A0A183SCD3_SCHSO|nr:unnamed protein product [Schistocephalus solidus]